MSTMCPSPRDFVTPLILPFRARKKLASGKIQMTANDFPTFLWSGDPPGNGYNEDATTEILFKGYVLERESLLIYSAWGATSTTCDR
jgi:hypothetical protein